MADRIMVDPIFSPREFGFTEDLDPQAKPVSTYVRPAQPAPSSLHGLASALSGFSQDLKGFMQKRQGQMDDRDKALAQAAAYKANGKGYAEAVSSGDIGANNSPLFQQWYKQTQGSILGRRLAAGAVDAYQQWPDRNSQDPANFDKFLGDYIKQNLNTDDPDVLAGAMPFIESTSTTLYNANEKERSSTLYNDGITTSIAASSMDIDNASDVALTKSSSIDYDGLWGQLMEDRQKALSVGVRAEDYDKQMVDMIHSKALEYMDPGILGMLKNKVPGKDFAYDDMDGSARTQTTLDTMESRQARIEAQKASLEAKQDRAELDQLTGSVLEELGKNPNAVIPQETIDRAVALGDGAFAVHVRDWAKTLASPVETPEDRASVLNIQQQVLAGAPMTVITDEIGKDITNPATLSTLYSLYNTVHSKQMDAVLTNPTVKQGLNYLRQSFTPTDLFANPDGITPDAIQAQTDFVAAMASWYQANPNASYTDVATQATKVLKDMQGTISDAHQYVRPDAVAEDLKGATGQGTPADPHLGQPPAAEIPQAAPTTPPEDPSSLWSKDAPPTMDQLPQDQQDKINERAQALGVKPEVIIKRVFDHMNADTTTDHHEDQSMNAVDANVTPAAKQLVNLIGTSEGTDRGRSYDETIGYGRWDPDKDAKLTDMSLEEVQKLQKKLVANGAPSGAVGRYQIINKTLKGLIAEMDLKPTDKFTPELQDQMMMHLLNRRGLQRYLTGDISRTTFANNLAKEWASLPLSSGKSHYGQRVGVSRAKLMSVVDQMLPDTTEA